MRKFRIGPRLNMALGAQLMLLLVLGMFGLYKLNTLSGLITDLYEHPFVVVSAVRDGNTDLIKVQRGVCDVVLASTKDESDRAYNLLDADQKELDVRLATAKAHFQGDSSLLDTVTAEYAVFKPVWQQEVELARAGNTKAAVAIMHSRGNPMASQIDDQMDQLVNLVMAQAATFDANAKATAIEAERYSLILLITCFIFCFVLAYFLTQSITRPLKVAVQAATAVSEGNLTIDLPRDLASDEAAQLTQSLSLMAVSLRTQIGEIMNGVGVLTTSASELAATSTQFASTATETASSVIETTSTVEEVKQTSRAATERAAEVADRAQCTAKISHDGEELVNATIAGIRNIREQMTFIAESVVRLSEQNQAISEIISTVDDLAEQSNLLAVNASIEAAKAGEHGKGFGVVAREVKSLAEQSRQATRQVRGILSDIQKATNATVMATERGSKSVDSGVTQSAQVGDSLRTLAVNINESALMAQQIVSATQQQYIGIDQVTMAMESIKVASGQNVEGARQLEVASRNLSDVGRRLQGLVERYRV